MKKLALATVSMVALMLPTGHGFSQPAPVPATPARPPAMQPLDPGEAFGATYGTGNLARPPTAVAPPRDPNSQRTPTLQPGDYLAAQNRRTQPPPNPSAFQAYMRNDLLLPMIPQAGGDAATLVLLAWNHAALDMTSIDHTTVGVKNVFETTYGEQFGPPRSARAMAMVHLAMFEAANAIDPHFQSYAPPGGSGDIRTTVLAGLTFDDPAPTPVNASVAAAIGQAAFDTLVALYPKKAALLEIARLEIGITVAAAEAAATGDRAARMALGREIGAAAARAVIDARQGDGSAFNAHRVPCLPSGTLPAPLCWEGFFDKTKPFPVVQPQDWTADAIVANPLRLGEFWPKVKPFALTDHEFVTDAGLALPDGTRPVPTAAELQAELAKSEYGDMIPDPHGGPQMIHSRYGVRMFGGWGPKSGTAITFVDGQGPKALTATNRTDPQTQWGNFWGYDATALLCAPPRLYNMVATSFLGQRAGQPGSPKGAVEVARYLALVNVAMADAGIAAWDAKYKYHVARPITYIRHVSTGNEDDAIWTPLGQAASNGAVTNVTPPFPAYPSGHAVFGGALFSTVAALNGVDKANGSAFDFVSDEYNGQTIGADGLPRERVQAHYVSLAAAEWENAESRIWLGIHWQRDADDGSALGDAIAAAVTTRILKPLTP